MTRPKLSPAVAHFGQLLIDGADGARNTGRHRAAVVARHKEVTLGAEGALAALWVGLITHWPALF
jgi:hypothetical protein